MLTAPVEVPIHLRHLLPPQTPPGGQKIKFVNPNVDNYDRNIKYAAKLHAQNGIATYRERELVQSGKKKGPPVIVCGSGNTLADKEVLSAMRHWIDRKGAIVFACKQAIKFLHDRGFKIDYGVTMDPGAHIARPEKIYKAPGMKHLVASSSDPLLFRYLRAGMPFAEWVMSLTEEERRRIFENDYDQLESGELIPMSAGEDFADVAIFHSATGYEKEVHLYETLFQTSACMGGGYNVVNRAVSAALFMGASKVVLAGCDCGWRAEETFYVDKSKERNGVDMSDHGIVEGTDNAGNRIEPPPQEAREWMTRPDMLASGVALAKLIKRNPDTFVVLGNTLPAHLIKKDEDFLNKCASFQ